VKIGMLVPAALYLMLQAGHPGESGWGTVMATDTASAVSALAGVVLLRWVSGHGRHSQTARD
jgi:Na+/H+ antiporter NhaA